MTAVLYRKTMTHQSNTQRERTERRARFRLKQLVAAAVLTALLTIGLGRFLVMEGYVLEPIRVEPVMQLPELPNGCEAASLAAVLQFYGYSVDKLDLAYGYIPRVDFWERMESVMEWTRTRRIRELLRQVSDFTALPSLLQKEPIFICSSRKAHYMPMISPE